MKYAFFIVVWRPNGLPLTRMGVTVSRKVAGAVGRNRIKRLVREAFRLNCDQRPTSMDISIIAKPGADTQSLVQVRRMLENAYSEMTSTAEPGCRPRA